MNKKKITSYLKDKTKWVSVFIKVGNELLITTPGYLKFIKGPNKIFGLPKRKK